MWNCFLMGLCHTLRNEVQAKLILDNELSRDFISFDFQCSKPLTNRETSVVRWHPITVILTNPILVWEWFQPNIEHWVVDHPPEASMIKKGSLPFSRSTCPMSVLKTLTVSRLSDSRVWFETVRMSWDSQTTVQHFSWQFTKPKTAPGCHSPTVRSRSTLGHI